MRGLVAAILLLLALAAPAAAKPPVVGEVAPETELTLVDGTKLTLADLRGQVVVLNFWATWCGPCKAELPLLDRYYQAQQKHGLRVFAITTEDSVPIPQLKKLFAVMAMPSVRRIRGRFAVLGALPTNYVIDRAGVVRYAEAGAFELETLNELLVPLLKEPAPAVTAAPGAAPAR